MSTQPKDDRQVPPPDIPLGPLDDTRKFFLANMAYGFNAQEVKQWFQRFGTVNHVKIIYDKHGSSRGYGFLFMHTNEGSIAVEQFAAQHGNRIEMLGRHDVFCARHDEQKAKSSKPPQQQQNHSDKKSSRGSRGSRGKASNRGYQLNTNNGGGSRPLSHYGPASTPAPPPPPTQYPGEAHISGGAYQQQPVLPQRLGAATYAPGLPTSSQPQHQQPLQYPSQIPADQYATVQSQLNPQINASYPAQHPVQAPAPPPNEYSLGPPSVAPPSASVPPVTYLTAMAPPEGPGSIAPVSVQPPLTQSQGYNVVNVPQPPQPQLYAAPVVQTGTSPYVQTASQPPTYDASFATQQVAPQPVPQPAVQPQPPYGGYSVQSPHTHTVIPGAAPQQQGIIPPPPPPPPPPPQQSLMSPMPMTAPTMPLSPTKIFIENVPLAAQPSDLVSFFTSMSKSPKRCTMEFDSDPNKDWCYAHLEFHNPSDASDVIATAQRGALVFRGRNLTANMDQNPPPDGVSVPVGTGAPVSASGSAYNLIAQVNTGHPASSIISQDQFNSLDPRGNSQTHQYHHPHGGGKMSSHHRGGRGAGTGKGRSRGNANGNRGGRQRDNRRDRPY